VPRNPRCVVTFEDGTEHAVRLIDISLSGAAFASDHQFEMGTAIRLGSTTAMIVRHFDGGYAAQFRMPLSADLLDENLEL
jgi:hypothetical protein